MFEQKQQGAVDIVSCGERINVEFVHTLASMLDEYVERGQPQVVLDMQGAVLVDSVGLELLLDTQEKYLRKGGALKLANVNPLCTEILKITGVGPRFESFPDVNSAVRSYVL